MLAVMTTEQHTHTPVSDEDEDLGKTASLTVSKEVKDAFLDQIERHPEAKGIARTATDAVALYTDLLRQLEPQKTLDDRARELLAKRGK